MNSISHPSTPLLLPRRLQAFPPEWQCFYKTLECFLVRKSQKLETVEVEVPWQTLQTFARNCGVREVYTEPVREFIGLGLLNRGQKYFNGNANRNGFCKSLVLNSSIIDEYENEPSLCLNKKEKRTLRVDLRECRDNQWRQRLKPLFAKSVKRFEYQREECVAAIEESSYGVLAKQAHYWEVFSETRWISVREGRRVYTSFVNSPRYLRRFIRLDGEPLVEFDASQLHYSLVAHASDDQQLLEWCHSGKFYERVCETLGVDAVSNRAEVKRLALAFLNCRNGQRSLTNADGEATGLAPLRRLFVKNFGKAFEFQKQVKKQDHRAMNELLDRLEWQAMLPIAQAIREQVAKPAGKLVLPLHDAIYVPASLADDAWRVINQTKPDHIVFKDGRLKSPPPPSSAEPSLCLC